MPKSLTAAIVLLAISQTLCWAWMYYVYPAMLPVWEADLGWSRADVSGAFTASLLVMAVTAPFVGRLIDRQASALVYTGAIATGAVILFLISLVETLWQFWLLWILLGFTNAACLYEAIFAIITVTVGGHARRAITLVTLVAGFATLVSFQSVYLLESWMDWRTSLQVFSGMLIGIALPLAIIGLRGLGHHRAPAPEKSVGGGAPARAMLRNPVFWLIGLAFAATGLSHGMIIAHIRPILDERGVAVTAAVLIASMIGPMQVFGRVVIVALGDRISTKGTAMLSFIGMLAGVIALNGAGMMPWLAFVFVVPYGAAYGITSIVRPVITADFLGRANFGVIAGMLAVPYGIANAIGPGLAAVIWSYGGYDLVLGLSIGLVMGGLGCMMGAWRFAAARPLPGS